MSEDKIAPKVSLEQIREYESKGYKRISFGNFDKKNNNLKIGNKYIYFAGVSNYEPHYMGELLYIGETNEHGSGQGDNSIPLIFERRIYKNKESEIIFHADINKLLFIEIDLDDEKKLIDLHEKERNMVYMKNGVQTNKDGILFEKEENNFKPDVDYFKNKDNPKARVQFLRKLNQKYSKDLRENGSRDIFSFGEFKNKKNKTINAIKNNSNIYYDTPIIYHIFGKDLTYISSGQKSMGELRHYIGNIENCSDDCSVIIINDNDLIKDTSEIDNKKEQQQTQEFKPDVYYFDDNNDKRVQFLQKLKELYNNTVLSTSRSYQSIKIGEDNIINSILSINSNKPIIYHIFDNEGKHKSSGQEPAKTLKDIKNGNFVIIINDDSLIKDTSEIDDTGTGTRMQGSAYHGGNRKSRKSKKAKKSKKSQKTKKAKKSRKKNTKKRNRKTRRH